MVKQNWEEMGKKILWFVIISIPVIFFQAVLYYYLTENIPEEGKFLGIIYNNVSFVWGLTLVALMVLWFIIKNIFEIKEKRGKL